MVPARTGAFTAVLCSMLISACATPGVRLSDSDRASFVSQPAIHVLHYQTPMPSIKGGGKNPSPAAAEIRKHAAADPAALIAQSFGRLLGKKEKLQNLKIEPHHLPLPVAQDTSRYREKYQRGLVLELWVDEWSFSPLPADTKTYQMTLNARSRLARVEDGRVLWSTGGCSVGGNNASNRDLRLLGTELAAGTRLRKVLAAARDECARQLLRDFDVRQVSERK